VASARLLRSCAGDVLTVEFTVAGIPCFGLNGGPTFKHIEATDDQQETDRYWNEAKRAFDAMMHMRKVDVAAIEAARRG
jgi:predicted 3-demethylubiquinone-9 3-methyltransferase (glyoxalase superfamily)